MFSPKTKWGRNASRTRMHPVYLIGTYYTSRYYHSTKVGDASRPSIHDGRRIRKEDSEKNMFESDMGQNPPCLRLAYLTRTWHSKRLFSNSRVRCQISFSASTKSRTMLLLQAIAPLSSANQNLHLQIRLVSGCTATSIYNPLETFPTFVTVTDGFLEWTRIEGLVCPVRL